MKRGVVERAGLWLQLIGGFEYPRWVAWEEQPTVMPLWKAVSWANAYGGNCVEVTG